MKRETGLFKRCKHLNWDSCACSWYGRYRDYHGISLAKWMGKRELSKTDARRALHLMRAQIDEGVFDVAGRTTAIATVRQRRTGPTFGDLIALYTTEHLDVHGRGNYSHRSALKVIGEGLGHHAVVQLEQKPALVEAWMVKTKVQRDWANVSFNRYRTVGSAVFSWAKRKHHGTANPFTFVDQLKGRGRRRTELTAAQEAALVNALRELPQPKQNEMRRRLFAALDCGLRSTEMLNIKLKHVHFGSPADVWYIELPETKSGEEQVVYVGTARLKAELTKRRFLEPDAFVFGREDGTFVKKFLTDWHLLFETAGLHAGRDGLVWHDLRHEYCNRVVEHTDNVSTIQDLMRHGSIKTSQLYMKAREAKMKEVAKKLGGPS